MRNPLATDTFYRAAVRKIHSSRVVLLAVLSLTAVSSAYSQQLQTFKDCVVGKRVSTNRDGRKGTITRLDSAWSYCYVRFDDNGKEESFLYSLLNAEGGLPAKDLNLRTGVYECVIGNREDKEIKIETAGRLKIEGPNAYSVGSAAGKYHVETSGKIVFETGPYKQYFSKLVSGGRIALSLTDSVFYGMTCEYNATLR
jgi:hypothetical protein